MSTRWGKRALVAGAAGLAWLFLLGASGAEAVTPSPSDAASAWDEFERDEFNHLGWRGTVTKTSTSPEGDSSSTFTWTDVMVFYECIETSCRLVSEGGVPEDGSDYAPQGELILGIDVSNVVFGPDGTFTATRAAEGTSACGDNNASTERTLSVVASAESVEWTASYPPRPAEACSDGSSVSIWGATTQLVGTAFSGNACVLDGAPCPPEPSPTPTATASALEPSTEPGGTTAIDSASELSSGAPSAPSVFSALPTIQDNTVSVAQMCLAIIAAVVLSVLVALPKKLYASVIASSPRRWREFTAWLARRPDRVSRSLLPLLTRGEDKSGNGSASEAERSAEDEEPNHRVGSTPWLKAALGVIAAALISAFVDPGFGFNAGSVRFSMSLVSSFLLTVVVGWSVAIWIARRLVPGLAASYSFKPLSLVVVAITVLFARVTHLEPGMVFGLVAGVALGRIASKATDAKVAVAQTGYAFALGLAGWGLYSVLAPGIGGGENVWAELLLDTLAGLTVAGFAAAPVALLPVAGMGGSKVYDWSRTVWFLLYGIGLAGFLLVLLPMPTSWSEVDVSLVAWFGIYLAYVGVALALYAAIVRPWERQDADASTEGVEGEA